MVDIRCDPADSGRQHYIGKISDAQKSAVKVATEVLAKYVGVYKGVVGLHGRPRVVAITLSGDALFLSVPGGEPERLFPQSETLFGGATGYRFIRDDRGIATDLVQMGFGGDFTLHREK
jgi:hypothetical protein